MNDFKNNPFQGLAQTKGKLADAPDIETSASKAALLGNKEGKRPNWVAVFRIEKSGRGGKTVTVIDQLPKEEIFLKELCKELKDKCGSGGTYSTTGKEGLIEIQGDKRDAIKAIFDKKQYRYKGM